MDESKHPDDFAIGEASIARGTRAIVELPVSRTAMGLDAKLPVQVLHGAKPGPIVFVSAAIHGDEITGTAIVQDLVRRVSPADLAGTLLLVPAVNIFGIIDHTRYLPDRRDLNRSFPGSPTGSMTARLAHCFLENVITRADLGIDLHSAAIHRYNLPQIRIAAHDPYLIELAMAFGAPVVIESPLRDGSMRQVANALGTPMLLLEAGEALRVDRMSLAVGTEGVLRVLAHIGMLQADDGMAAVTIPARANHTTWVRAPRGGVTQLFCRSGDPVRAGAVLAQVGGLFGEDALDVISPIDGIVIGHATLPIVHHGDALFHIAQIANAENVGEHVDSIAYAIRLSEPAGSAQDLMDEDEVL